MKNREELTKSLRDALLRTMSADDAKYAERRTSFAMRERAATWTIDFLGEEESPYSCVQASTKDAPYSDWGRKQEPPTGLLCLTNRRIMFVCEDKGGLLTKHEPLLLQFDINSITAVRHDTTGTLIKSPLIHLHISTTAAGGHVTQVSFEVRLDGKQHGITKRFIADVEDARRKPGSKQVTRSDANTEESSVVRELRYLRTLKLEGLLSDAEFEAAKKKLLDL